MNKTVLAKLNSQLNAELYSSYLYLSMSTYAASRSLNGCAHWFRMQADEERVHAMKIYDYMVSRAGNVVLDAIQKPLCDFESIVDVFEKAYGHECHVTQLLNDLAGVAMQEHDQATVIFMSWFITEQIEEESNVKTIVDQLQIVHGTGEGLLMIDRELGARQAQAAETK